MQIVYHPGFEANLSHYGIQIPLLDNRSGQVFSSLKKHYPHLAVLNLALMKDFIKPTQSDLFLAHEKKFVSALFGKNLDHEIKLAYELIDSSGNAHRFNPESGIYPLKQLFTHILHQTHGVVFAMNEALKNEFCYFLGGGMHHGMSRGGRGFSLINDIVVGLRKLQALGLIKTAWVIDVDAHKGDGTAEITQHDSSITTLSVHMAQGWPFGGAERDQDPILERYPEGRPWEVASDLDFGIKTGEEANYLEVLEHGLFEISRNFKRPDLCIVVNGSDPYEKDCLPSAFPLKLSLKQMLDRDLMIFNTLKKQAIPQCYLMAGGYGPHAWEPYAQFLLSLLGKAHIS